MDRVKTITQLTTRRTVQVPASVEDAFDFFTERFAVWWPHEYTWSGETLQGLGIEPRVGGRCFELGPHELRYDWGRVLTWEPPHRLVIAWQIGPDRAPEPDPEKASEVEVRFVSEARHATRIELEHRGFERHGTQGVVYRDAMASHAGWAYILEQYRRRMKLNGSDG